MEVEITVGGKTYSLEHSHMGCIGCALRKICFRGQEIYKSRAWLCQIFSPGMDRIFVETATNKVLKEDHDKVYI